MFDLDWFAISFIVTTTTTSITLLPLHLHIHPLLQPCKHKEKTSVNTTWGKLTSKCVFSLSVCDLHSLSLCPSKLM